MSHESNHTGVSSRRDVARVARIPYVNAAPYYVDWARLEHASEGTWKTAEMPPRQLGMAMEGGSVDAGLMAVADLIRLRDQFEPLSIETPRGNISFGIANRDRVDSVLLFVRDEQGGRPLSGRRPTLTLDPAALRLLEGARIAVTAETSTSFRLLRLLLEVRYGVSPHSYERVDLGQREELRTAGPDERITSDRLGSFDAALVIGDLALSWRWSPPTGLVQAMDLAREWFAWTRLPFVFARWGVRRDIEARSKLWLGNYLHTSLTRGMQDLESLVRDLPRELGSEPQLVEYLENFVYELGPDEEESEARFRDLLRDHGIVCSSE